MVNSNVDEIVLPCFTCVGSLGSGVGCIGGSCRACSAGRGVRDLAGPSGRHCNVMPPLSGGGRSDVLLRNLLHRYAHVFFPAPGEPVTGHTTSVQHEILTSDAQPVRCGPRQLAPASLRTEHMCVKEMLEGGQIEPWASPVVLVTKKRWIHTLLCGLPPVELAINHQRCLSPSAHR